MRMPFMKRYLKYFMKKLRFDSCDSGPGRRICSGTYFRVPGERQMSSHIYPAMPAGTESGKEK